MPRSPRQSSAATLNDQVSDFRHDARRKNLPEAGMEAQGHIQEQPTRRYAYDPHLPPVLRFDPTGQEDALPELLAEARQRPLTNEEVHLLAGALQHRQPWLEWSGKRESTGFAVAPVALHIHERVAAKAIIAAAARQEIQRSLFADPELEYRERVQFYQHDVDWSNRLILGDSLQVMTSLAEREGLSGSIQMIYVDPPYGISYRSNFQPTVGKRDVKDKDTDLTREPEVVAAYRDTWELGLHSYLSYLRDRLVVVRQLLKLSGSAFIQISDENLHVVKQMLDEVFGARNFISQISFKKTGGFETETVAGICDYILWYARSRDELESNPLFIDKVYGEGSGERYSSVLFLDGTTRPASEYEGPEGLDLPPGARLFLGGPTTSDGAPKYPWSFRFQGRDLQPKSNQHWKSNPAGMQRLAKAERLFSTRDFVNYFQMLDDFALVPMTNMWTDTMGTAERDKAYVVQTALKVIERCMLMATKPGDLVLDPTSGSGTTAFAAEKWGRRWIAIDTSRVANAIARQRLLTAAFDYYELKDQSEGVDGGFQYETVPHISLKSIAQNQALDPVFARHEPILSEKLAALNKALQGVTVDLRPALSAKLAAKQKTDGKRSITEADRRRWNLPKSVWQEWEVPFDTDPLWPQALRDALVEYRAVWRAKMDEVNATIAQSAEQEELVDKPIVVRNVRRVSGPFTVESVLPVEENLDDNTSPFEEFAGEMETFGENGHEAVADAGITADPQNAAAFIEQMIGLLRADGARFLGNKTVAFDHLEPLSGTVLHAEGAWCPDSETERSVAVSFGPQVGNVSARQVEQCLRVAYRKGYDDLLFAGFGFDDAAQAIIQDDPNPAIRCHLLQIRPDVSMGDLLKTTANSQIFTVLALPRTSLKELSDGEWQVTMEGMDVYDPVANTILPTSADKVAAWFLDTDYDGRTFCICQAFFPDKSAWDKLAKSLRGVIDDAAFAAFSGDTSLPFRAGQHERVCVKVIDPRGNEATRVHALTDAAVYADAVGEQ